MPFLFPKSQKLTSRDEISQLVSHGKTLFKYPFKVWYIPRPDGWEPRYVVSVPKKNFKRAVHRNLLKRRTREAIRLNQKEILGSFTADYFFVYIAKEFCDYSVIEAAVKELLHTPKKHL